MRAQPPTRPVRKARPRPAALLAAADRQYPVAAALLFLLACTPSACTPPPDLPGPAAESAARDLWQTRCANCHGLAGHGDGLSGRSLAKPPRDFHDATWQAHVTDDHIKQIIVEGGHAVGLSPDMAANADLEHRPSVVAELVKIVRSFATP